MKRGAVLILAAIALFGTVLWMERGSQEPQRAFETLSRSKLMVNTAFELEELEPLPDGLSDRLGTIHASYRGPDEFDALKVEVYESEPAAEEQWQRYLASAEGIRTTLSTRQPRFRDQVCTLKNQTAKCAARIYEAIVEGAAGGSDTAFHEETIKANAQTLLMAGIKHWLNARDLGLPEEQEM